MTKPKTSAEWKAILLKDWPSRVILTAVVAFCGFAAAQSNAIVEKKILDTVKAPLDSLAKKVETTDQKVDKVDAKLDAMIEVMGRAFPEFKKEAKEWAQENQESKELQNTFSGDAP